MTGRGLRFALVCAVAAMATASHAAELFPIYATYQKAVAAGDAAAAKALLSEGRRAQLEDLPDAEALGAMSVVSPKTDLRLHKEIFDGDDATLIVRANIAGNDSTGRLQFVREEGAWKILSEMWDIGGDPDDAGLDEDVHQPVNDSERAAIRKLREIGFPVPSGSQMSSATVQGNLQAVKLFVEAGYSPDTRSQGSPLIVSAAMFGQPHVVEYLVEAGADVNALDDVNTTALMRVADKCRETATVQLLLKSGAKTHFKSAGGATAEQMAEWSNCKDNVAAIKAAK